MDSYMENLALLDGANVESYSYWEVISAMDELNPFSFFYLLQ